MAAKARGVKCESTRPDLAVANKARADKALKNAERLREILAPMAMADALQAAGVYTSDGNHLGPDAVSRSIKRLALKGDA